MNPWPIQEEHQAAWCVLWWEALLQAGAGSGWCLCCRVSMMMPKVWAGTLCFWSWCLQEGTERWIRTSQSHWRSCRLFQKRTGLSANALIRFFPSDGTMGGKGWWLLFHRQFQRMPQVPAAPSGSTPSYCPYTAHSHEQAWMSLMATEQDKICLVCNVIVMVWFGRYHKLNGPSIAHTYCLLGAAGLPGQQQEWSYLTSVTCSIPIPASQAGWWKPW